MKVKNHYEDEINRMEDTSFEEQKEYQDWLDSNFTKIFGGEDVKQDTNKPDCP